MTITERKLWYYLDTLAVSESALGGDRAKADAAVALMERLEQPTPEECRHFHDLGCLVE